MRRYIIPVLALCLLLTGTAFAREMNVIGTDTSNWPLVRVVVETPGRDADASHYILRTDDPKNELTPSSVREIMDKPLLASMVIAVDTGGGLGHAHLEAVKTAIGGYANQLIKGERVAILSFNDKVSTISDFTTDSGELKKRLAGLSLAGKTTEPYSAILDGIGMLKTVPGQHTLLVITHEGKKNGGTAAGYVLEAAQANDVRIFAVGLPSPSAKETEESQSVLHALSADTGGLFRQAVSPQDLLAATFELMVEHQDLVPRIYELTFEIPGDAMPQPDAPWTATLGHVIGGPPETALLKLNAPLTVPTPPQEGAPPVVVDQAPPPDQPVTTTSPIQEEEPFLARNWPWLLPLALILAWLLTRMRLLAPKPRPRTPEGPPLFIEFPDSGRRFPLNPGTTVLGSGPGCDITVTDPLIGEALMEFCVGDITSVRGLPGTQQVLLNGKPVDEVTPLKPGDELTFGSHCAVIRSARDG